MAWRKPLQKAKRPQQQRPFSLLIPFTDRLYLFQIKNDPVRHTRESGLPIGFIFFRSKTTPFVIPAKAGIPFFSGCLDSRVPRVREDGNDENRLRMGIS